MTNTDTKFTPVNVEERKKLDVCVGDTVRVYLKIEEKGKTRLQPYEGLVIARKHGSEPGATITVRRVASGIGMEKIIPIYSPVVGKIDVLKRSKVRRSKLYYIREKATKEARKKMKQLFGFDKLTAIDESKEPEKEEEEPVEKIIETEEEEKIEEVAEAPEEEEKTS